MIFYYFKKITFIIKKTIPFFLLKRRFNGDYNFFIQQTNKRFIIKKTDLYPFLYDAGSNADFDRHYTYHTAWAARVLAEINPKKHVDISSDLRFVTLISAFIPLQFYDYRPIKIELSNLKCEHVDVTQLPFKDNSIDSLSCMHVVEHIGLGRYGDQVDPEGDIKAMKELARVVAKNGSLLFVVPIGNEAKIMFNAHRIYTKDMIINIFKHLELNLREFTLIPELESDGGLISDPNNKLLNKQTYACGCFWFTK